MRRPVALSPEAEAALAHAREVCTQLGELETDREDLMDERDTAWAEAFAAGCTQGAIAEGCGCSEILVRNRLAAARGADWAQR